MEQIIKSLLENDLYKFSMGQVIYHHFPIYSTTWTFKCRNDDVYFTDEMVEEIKRQIKLFCKLSFKEEELNYLRGIKWLRESYIDFLRLWHPRYEDFSIEHSGEKGLCLEASGSWLNTSMYEVPTLAIVNEVYFRMRYSYPDLFNEFKERANHKVDVLSKGVNQLGNFSEFGLRRRLSSEAQDYIVHKLMEVNSSETPAQYKSHFVGTSNVYLAKKYNITPVGTMAHEYIQAQQGNLKHNSAYSNYYAMRTWVDEYGILNGTALTDTITTDLFLKDFDLTFATLFSGVRHDSGDPFVWGEKIISHYEKLGIDPKTKTLLFSDSLNFERAHNIYDYFKDRCKVAFGIGTFLSNDTSVEPLNIVMKVTNCNGHDVAKISDTPGKGMCKNPDYVEYLQRCINWRMEHSE